MVQYQLPLYRPGITPRRHLSSRRLQNRHRISRSQSRRYHTQNQPRRSAKLLGAFQTHRRRRSLFAFRQNPIALSRSIRSTLYPRCASCRPMRRTDFGQRSRYETFKPRQTLLRCVGELCQKYRHRRRYLFRTCSRSDQSIGTYAYQSHRTRFSLR